MRESEVEMTKKCEYCGREGCAPKVRGAKSAAVSIGNYRMAVDVDVEVCEECSEKLMAKAMDALILAITVGRGA